MTPCAQCRWLLQSPTKGICATCYDPFAEDPVYRNFEAGDWRKEDGTCTKAVSAHERKPVH